MPKMIDGSIACRISLAPEYSKHTYYCDHCGEYFDDRHNPPCEAVTPPGFDSFIDALLNIPEGALEDEPKKKKRR